jgi:hypothetical protein
MPMGWFGSAIAACLGMLLSAAIASTAATAKHVHASTARDRFHSFLPWRNSDADPAAPASQITNPLANGAAARWHG